MGGEEAVRSLVFAVPADAAPCASTDELEQIRKARAGDRRAFGLLYERYRRLVHGVLLARVPAAEAEDLAQEVFLRAMGRLDQLRDEGALGAWLAAMARSRALEYFRARRRRPEAPLEEGAGSGAPGWGEALVVLNEIRRLPEAYRETLVLRLVEGLNGAEIAAQCGLTPDSVRVNLSRGMKMLRERLGGAAR